MNWLAQTDGYCERLDFGFWAEPLNAVTNISFILAAMFMWRRCEGLVLARLLCGILFALGIGSFLFHTTATNWAMAADVLPIMAFVLVLLFGLGAELPAIFARRGKPWRDWLSGGALVLFFLPFSALLAPMFQRMALLGSSAGYFPVPSMLGLYILVVMRRAPRLARNLAIGLAVMLISLTIRTIDLPLCAAWPYGTHFLWHSINGAMLAWFIEVYRRHMLEGGRAAR
ncbi:MAG: ceramidase domain-containing protein [Paracoccaceae bacterium]